MTGRLAHAMIGLLSAAALAAAAMAQADPGKNESGRPEGKRDDRQSQRAYERGYSDGSRDRLERGAALGSGSYRVLGAELYRDRYGRPLRGDARYVETEDGARLIIEAATGIILDILDEATRPLDGRPVQRGRGAVDIPQGHYPPPGECRVWFPDRSPGQQPPPGSCGVRVPRGAVLIRG